ncbi:MAG: glutathione S-transferase family protein [Deltaproteobacteria bacterium]|nr:glutathione S-transferase family protein [Deltaproteobacteria bacterium]
MKLYWFWSFNPQKVRLALHELGLAHDLVAVDLFRGQQRHPDFVRLNPHAKVPVLEDGAMVLTESNAMLAYLGERERRLWPADAAGKAAALRWLFLEARHLSENVGNLWFNDFVAPQVKIPVSEADRARGAEEIAAPLGLVEVQLGKHAFVNGAEFSLVDCCYAPVLDALSLSAFDLAPYPNVSAYLARMRLRPAWAKCEFRTA